MNKLIGLIYFLFLGKSISAQQIKLLSSTPGFSIRGLSVVDDQTIWVSGSSGTVGKSLDGGNTWKFVKVKGFEKTDFRDIEAFDENNAIIMGIECPARIFRTADGGNSWKLIFEDSTKGMFLDAMEFWDEHAGVVIGDPINEKSFVAHFKNEKWTSSPIQTRPLLDSGEAFFASSGTNIRALNKKDMVVISGGMQSNLFIDNKKIKLPLLQGTESTGANSIALKNSNTFMIVGGDFMQKDSTSGNYCFTKDKGKTWIPSLQAPTGYRSCVEYINENNWITCGLNGVDYTTDNGLHFKKISDIGFHVCRKAKKGNAIFLAGGGGRIGQLIP